MSLPAPDTVNVPLLNEAAPRSAGFPMFVAVVPVGSDWPLLGVANAMHTHAKATRTDLRPMDVFTFFRPSCCPDGFGCARRLPASAGDPKATLMPGASVRRRVEFR